MNTNGITVTIPFDEFEALKRDDDTKRIWEIAALAGIMMASNKEEVIIAVNRALERDNLDYKLVIDPSYNPHSNRGRSPIQIHKTK